MDELEFNKDIGEMSEAEVRATLRDVTSKYSEAREDYTEFQSEKEQMEDDLDTYKQAAAEGHDFFAERASEVKDMPKETIKEKFTTEEIRGELLEEAEFQIASPETEDEEPEEESKFDEKEEKSDNLPGDGGSEWYDQEAERAVQKFTVQHDHY